MKDTKHWKDLLTNESENLLTQLKSLGRKNPDTVDDWETTKKEDVQDSAEEGDVADNIEEFENNNAVLENLETRLHEVNKALNKIDDGSYGKCEVCGKEIEEDRLDANPAATTCVEHMN